MRHRAALTADSIPPTPPCVEETPEGVRVWCRPRGGRETWEVVVRHGEPLGDLVVRLAWGLRVPVDRAEILASEVLLRLAASAPSTSTD